MRSRVLPFLLGFILLGTFSHAAARHGGDHPVTPAAPAAGAATRLNLPKQLRASDEVVPPGQDAGMAPLPAFVPDAGDSALVWSI